MFSDKKEKPTTEPTVNQNRINEGTFIKGDITSNGFFRIDGIVEGNVSKPSRVVVGKKGMIKGTLVCENADIEGKVEGNIDIKGTLLLKSTAYIDGDVITGKLSVEPGATFIGSCAMHGVIKTDVDSPLDTPTSKESLKEKTHPFDRSQRIQKSKAEKQN